MTARNTASHFSPTAQLLNFRDKRRASNTNHKKVLDVWQGGSRRPGVIVQSGNRDEDNAIHPTENSKSLWEPV